MIRRTFDADYINYLANHPTIRPFVGGDGQSHLDLAAVVADDKNVFLVGDHGGFCFTWSAPETYEAHTFILPEGRGKAAYRIAREACEWMEATGATHLWTRVAETMPHVRRFTLAAGFKPCGRQTVDLGGGPVTYELLNRRTPCL